MMTCVKYVAALLFYMHTAFYYFLCFACCVAVREASLDDLYTRIKILCMYVQAPNQQPLIIDVQNGRYSY